MFIKNYLSRFLKIDELETIKMIYLSIVFFFIVCSSSIFCSLKTSIFLSFVGREYQPIEKILSIIIMVPTILFYSKVIDKLKRHQLVYFFIFFYIVIGIIFSYVFLHPIYGIRNSTTNFYRVSGWIFEIFMDLFKALVTGSLCSFINSISTPSFARRSYGFMHATSCAGGVFSTFMALLVMKQKLISDFYSIPLLTFLATLFLVVALFFVHKTVTVIPKKYLLGYTDLHIKKSQAYEKKKDQLGVFEGLKKIISEPYVFGIFGLVFVLRLQT